jgi:hypothetical protein
VQPAGARQLVQADDWITKFQGTWVSSQGKTMFVQARYVAWVVFAFVFPAVMIVDYALTGSVSLLPLTDASIAVLLTYGITNLTNGEVTLAHVGVYALRWGRQLSARAAARIRTPAASRARLSTDRVRVQLLPAPDCLSEPGTAAGPPPGRDLVVAPRPARDRGCP